MEKNIVAKYDDNVGHSSQLQITSIDNKIPNTEHTSNGGFDAFRVEEPLTDDQSLLLDFWFSLFNDLEKTDNQPAEFTTSFHQFMEKTVESIRQNKSYEHFNILNQLCQRLDCSPRWLYEREPFKLQWPSVLMNIAKGIIQSHIGDKERYIAFNLISAMISCFGSAWLSQDTTFMQLAVSLASIEVRLCFDAPPFEENQEHLQVLPSCCSILQNAIEIVATNVDDEYSTFTTQQLIQMNDQIVDLMRFLLLYISTEIPAESILPQNVFRPLYCLIATFLSEGSELIEDSLMEKSKDCIKRLEFLYSADCADDTSEDCEKN